ncbi:MAG TPA: hypothetical protein VKJ01_00300 [Candidatus Solibacter sp.]|nr:hypothetical protein [Candidatus Solibacter sp.]
MDRLLGRDEVVGHELIYGELLIGDRGGRRKLLAAYERMRQAGTVPYSDVVAFVRARGLHGRGLPLWTADSRFSAVAKEVSVA